MGIQWSTPPEKIAVNIEALPKRYKAALHAIAVRWGQQVQDAARRGAPWQDRTGNARGGLFFAVDGLDIGTVTGEIIPSAGEFNTDSATVEGDENNIVIVLSHTVFYGKFLELSNGAKYAIIMSTIEGNLPSLERMVRELLE
jgi:hypothetical protein